MDLFTYAYSNHIAIVGNNKLTIYNSSANVENTIDVVVNTPKFYSNGNYLLLADENGQNLYCSKRDTLVFNVSPYNFFNESLCIFSGMFS